MSGPQLGGVATDIPIYWSNPKLWLAAACIIFNPLFWNVVSALFTCLLWNAAVQR